MISLEELEKRRPCASTEAISSMRLVAARGCARLAVRPCLRALREDLALPAADLGPVCPLPCCGRSPGSAIRVPGDFQVDDIGLRGRAQTQTLARGKAMSFDLPQHCMAPRLDRAQHLLDLL